MDGSRESERGMGGFAHMKLEFTSTGSLIKEYPNKKKVISNQYHL